MPRPTSSSSIALILCLGAAPAWADLTAADVWQDWQDYMTSTGYSLAANADNAGGVLTITDMTMALDMGDDGRVVIDYDDYTIVMTPQSDGSVAIGLSEDVVMNFEITSDLGEEITMVLGLTQSEPTMIATGAPGAITYDYASAQVTAKLDGVQLEGVILTDEIARVDMVMTDVAYTSASTVGDLRGVTQDMSVGTLTYDVFFNDEANAEQFAMKGEMRGMAFDGAGDLPLQSDGQDVNAMLNDGFAFDGTFTTTGGAYDATFNSEEGGGTINATSDGANVRVAMDAAGLNYEVAQSGVSMNMLLTELPLPISFQATEMATNLLFPVQKSEDEQDFGLGIRLTDFQMADTLWGLFDPAGQLPRDPASLVIDLAGKAKVLFDFLDPAQAAILEQADAAPGELNALTLNTLDLDVVGARLTGSGDFTFDNSDLVTFDGLPRPQGAVDLTLVGGNGLIDTLVRMGLLPEDQAMGARMMMGLFAVPGEGEDTLNSRIEVNEEGHVLANGQRLR